MIDSGHMLGALPSWLTSPPPLLAAALVAIVLVTLAGLGGGGLARLMRFCGNLVLLGVFAVACLRFVQLDPSFAHFMPSIGMPEAQVSGGEVRVPLASDGHYWIEANVNGTRTRFMVDTGATITTLSAEGASEAGIAPDPLRLPVVMHTANGDVEAQTARVETLKFGSIVARDMDVIVSETTGGLNVLGMNFLNRLKGWRVEEGVLILTPRHPQSV
jgi:aspartyl protease family protein